MKIRGREIFWIGRNDHLTGDEDSDHAAFERLLSVTPLHMISPTTICSRRCGWSLEG